MCVFRRIYIDVGTLIAITWSMAWAKNLGVGQVVEHTQNDIYGFDSEKFSFKP